MIKTFFILSMFLWLPISFASAQMASLRHSINEVIKGKNADVGVAIYDFSTKDTFSVSGNKHYPMQSVYKFHLALAVLNLVDLGKYSLQQKILIRKSDLLKDTYSPLRVKYPKGNVKLPLAEILRYTVSESDNNGCDILFRLIGGPKTVNDYMHRNGTTSIAIVTTEEDMHKEWSVQFKNWTSPVATVQLLKTFYNRKLLSDSSHEFLWRLMLESGTGKNRIKALLPKGTAVAHKTGTSDSNEAGITAAVNDIGFVQMPNGKHFAIAVFVTNSKEGNATNERIIAEISKLAWDHFVD